MRTKPYMCMICGQLEQKHYDPDLEIEFYSDDPEHDTLDFWLQEFQFPTGKITIRTCGECSTIEGTKMFEIYQARVKAGEIPYFH